MTFNSRVKLKTFFDISHKLSFFFTLMSSIKTNDQKSDQSFENLQKWVAVTFQSNTSVTTTVKQAPLKKSTGSGLSSLRSSTSSDGETRFKNGKDGYNPSNKMITRQFIEKTLSNLCGYSVKIGNLEKYQLAFVHKSVYRKNIAPPDKVIQDYLKATNSTAVPDNPPLPIGTFRPDESGFKSRPLVFTDTYETMEFCGDGWIGAVVGQYIKHRFPCQSEGFYSKLKSHIVCKDGLSKVSRHLGFGEYALISSETEQLIGRNNLSLLEDIFEAFCDALVEDLGVGLLRVVIKNLIESVIDFRDAIINDSNFKDVFKRVCKHQGWSLPQYVDLGDNGLIGTKKEYSVGILMIPDLTSVGVRSRSAINSDNKPVDCVAIGSGATKKKAQQSAALNAMRHIETATGVKF